jgi:hypothetical protein
VIWPSKARCPLQTGRKDAHIFDPRHGEQGSAQGIGELVLHIPRALSGKLCLHDDLHFREIRQRIHRQLAKADSTSSRQQQRQQQGGGALPKREREEGADHGEASP